VRVLDPRRAKGLEFDDLIVAAPEAIIAGSTLGAHDLYVALTRATRSLTVVTSRPDLPVLTDLDVERR
jgi:DNA helicase IV